MERFRLNNLSKEIIGAAIEVHRCLGPGLLESTYQIAMMYELQKRGISAMKEVEIPIRYKGVLLETAFRADLIIENEIIVELKATESDSPLHTKQLLTYLKLTGIKLGLLINFNRISLIDGITRVVNDF